MDELAANKEHEIYPCGIILPLNSTVQQVKRTKQSNQMEDASLNKNENKKKKKIEKIKLVVAYANDLGAQTLFFYKVYKYDFR